MKRGYILLSAIGALVLLGIVGAFVLKEAATTSAIKSTQIAKTKADLVALSSEAVVINEVLKHDFNQSCLDKFQKSFSNGEVIASYELTYSDDIGLCSGAFSANEATIKELRVMVKATIISNIQGTLIRKLKIFNLKI
ncbi:hypothetical protein [Campylobacter sp. 19-13652]|uniref:hypothetical protein n=1 Tax=Campylobacter sp. 19-13652 TaxID=2840180 RepID=UPI001C788603|nr:hypothetical protein [Campylobacter sp. 19-13652]BCX79640.1 hypothetical protein LBC_11020 [Campylobacter sp. 19-13652]